MSDLLGAGPAQTLGRKQEYYGLQVLRAVAALAVVAGHSADFLATRNGGVPWQLSWLHGPAGVDIFFVISGFVMMISAGGLLARPRPARNFLLRRLIRIVPLYWLLTLVKVALVIWKPQLAEHSRPSNWNIISSFLFIPSTGASGDIRPVIPLGWTLSFEMSFYLVFAAGLAASGRILRIVTPAIVALALVGVFRRGAWPVWSAIADPIVLEFLAGVWIAHWTMRGRMPTRPFAVAGVLLGFLGVALVLPGANPLSRPFTWGIFAIMIVMGTVALEGTIGSRFPRWLLLLGDASYSIYLIQVFVFPGLHLAIDRWAPNLVHEHALLTGVLMIVSSLLATSAVGVAVYHRIERPMTIALRDQFGASKPHAVTP